jgi:uncharacterized membrane protein
MNKIIGLVLGVLMIGGGWAIRSTFIVDNYANKPLGGAMITVGGLIVAMCAYSLMRKPPKNKDM